MKRSLAASVMTLCAGFLAAHAQAQDAVIDGITSGGGTSRCLPAQVDGNRCRLQQHRRDYADVAAAALGDTSGLGLLHLHAACTRGAEEKRTWLASMGYWHDPGSGSGSAPPSPAAAAGGGDDGDGEL